MVKHKIISVFEHQRLCVGEKGFKQSHLDALLKLNEFHEGNYFEPIAKGIKFNQYVGVIQIDGISIEINPKSDKYDEDEKWKGVLLNMLQACGRISPQSTGAAHVKRQNLNLLEVYFELFLKELDKIIRRGLIKQYRKETSNVKALKGKLEFAGNIRQNIVHKERFFTSHQVYDTNHKLHQILHKALTIIEQFTRGTRLYDFTRRVLLNFPEMNQNEVTIKDLNSVELNRKTSHYNYALELARLIILNYSPDISSGKEKMISLLFDMNELWEEYILKQIQRIEDDFSIKVSGQESKPFWGSNSLRPDIVIRKNNKRYIIDTKWKRPMKSSASVADLRQMYSYCRFWDAEKALLLYPGNPIGNIFKEFKTDDYCNLKSDVISINHSCKMGFVSVLNHENKLDLKIGEKVLEILDLPRIS